MSIDRPPSSAPQATTQVSGGPADSRVATLSQQPVRPDPMEATQWSVGQVIDGRFEVRAIAGSGGMGIVYRAYDQEVEREVAIKLLRPEADQARFEREARLLSTLEHANIVRHFAHGMTHDAQMYLAMEWLEGVDLAQYLDQHRMSIKQAVAVVSQVASALTVAHDVGVIHRDINPRNIFLVEGDPEQVKVLDFGVARALAGTRPLTSAGSPIGTPGYMAPEQAQGARQVTKAADVFGLGCVLYECLTGKRAFAGRTLMELFARILVDDVPPVRDSVAAVPPELDALVSRMLHKSAAQRPQHAAEVVESLLRLGPLSDALMLEPTAPAPDSAITDAEQRLSSIVLLTAPGEAAFSRVVEKVLVHGVKPQQMADGSVLIVVSNRGSATDQVAAAASCALDVKNAVLGVSIAVATGRAVTNGQKPVGEAIERASAALVAVSQRPLGLDDASRVYLDQVTAGLLDSRFDVVNTEVGLVLNGMLEGAAGVRPVLGRRTRCVGRRRELSLLRSTLDECVEDQVARPVLVTGAPGIGKTRLAHEFVRGVRREAPETLVLASRGEPTGIGSPFAILGRGLRGMLEIGEGREGEVQQALWPYLKGRVKPGDLSRVFEFLCELMGAPLPEGSSAQLDAARLDHVLAGDQMLRAFEDWLEAECQERPLLFVLDDLHWGDLPSVKFLDAALRNLSERPLMVLAMGQPEVHEVFPGLWARRGVSELRLTGLSRRSSESLVREVLGEDTSLEVVERVVEKGQGNPFWLEELIRVESEAATAPDAVVLLAQARLERLSDDARLVLRAASVLGRHFWEGGVSALLGAKLSRVQLSHLLGSLEEREVVSAASGGKVNGGREFEFCSSLLRDAAYGTLTADDRQRAHLAAGTWLEGVGENDAVTLAEHFSKGGAGERAVHWYQRAAEQALSGNDWEAARRRARQGRDAGPPREVEVRLVMVEAEASKWLGDNSSALERSLGAMRKASRGDATWCRACGEAIATAGKLGQQDVYARLGPELLGVVTSESNREQLLVALSRGVTQLVLCGELSLAEALLARVTDSVEQWQPTVATLGWSLEARAVHAGAVDDASGRVELAARAAEAFEEAGDLRNACLQRISVGFGCVEMGAYARAREALTEALEVAKRMGLSNSIPIARAQLGRALAHLGDLGRARGLLHEALEDLDRHENPRLRGAVRCYLADVLLAEQAVQLAEQCAEQAVLVLESVPAMQPSALATLAKVRLQKGEIEAALALAAQANRGVDDTTRLNFGEALVRLSYILALLASGDHVQARQRLLAAKMRLMQRASLISDPELKKLFLTAVPENARTLELASTLEAP